MKLSEIPEIKGLSLSEKLLLVEELWEDVRAHADEVQIPSWHIKELEESYREYLANPKEGSSWADVRARLLARRV